MRHSWVVGIAVLACLVVAAGAAARTQLATSAKKTKVTLQLKWVTQAQFAGYYAAKTKGYYSKAGLDVTLKVGGPSSGSDGPLCSFSAYRSTAVNSRPMR